MSTLVAATASPTATPAAPAPVSKSETVVPAAQFLLIQATTVSSSAAATTTSATPAPAPVAHSLTPHLPPVVPSLVPSIVPSSPTSSVLPASQSPLSSPQVPAPIIYSQRLPPGRLPHVQPPVLNQETRSRVVIEAIDSLRGRKARPDENRITHWVNRRYGIQKDEALNILNEGVDSGRVIRVKYKDSISYRNPAKFPRSSSQVNQMMYRKQQQSQNPQQQLHHVQHQVQNGSSNPGDKSQDAGPSAGSSGMGSVPLAPIPAIKKILRAIRTLTTKSADPSAGASVQQVIALIGQRELGMPATFVSRVLKAGVIQGTVRLLPSGNYILASGVKKKKAAPIRKAPAAANAASASSVGPAVVSNGSAAVTAASAAPGAHRVTLIPPKSVQQTLLQSRSVVPPVVGPSAGAAAPISQSLVCAAANGVIASNNNSLTVPAAHPPANASQSQKPQHQQSLHHQVRHQPGTISGAVLTQADVSVRRRKKLQFRQFLASRAAGVPRHRIPGAADSKSAGNASEVERGRPISKRKKFKSQRLGSEFLQPSELGMAYLQNSFEPKCDYCDRPASRSPNNKHEEFLICKDCGFKAHPKSCLKYSEELISRCRESLWQCQYCKDCCMCDKSGDVESILFCDACDQGYHMACHKPPLASKPDGAWICTFCHARRKGDMKVKPQKNGDENNAPSDDGYGDDSEEMLEESDMDEDVVEEMDIQSNGPVGGRVIQCNGKDNTEKIISQLQPNFEQVTESHPNLAAQPKDWGIDDVETFIRSLGFNDQAAIFKEQEIDGVSLLLLKRSDLLSGMDMKLGPAVKIYGHIQRLQTLPPPTCDAGVESNVKPEPQPT